MSSRVFYDLKSKGYIEPNDYGGWDWSFSGVPVNRGPQMQGTARFRLTAKLHLWRATKIANKYGFRP
jgi:hypothetical protein